MTNVAFMTFGKRLKRLLARFWQSVQPRLVAFFKNPIAWVLLLILFSLVTRPIFDPDFFWHLQSGLDFWKRGWVAQVDPYSWTMPNWPWVDHEWLADAFLAPWYLLTGPVGVSVFYGLVITTAFLLAANFRPVRMEAGITAALIGAIAGLPILGARQQMFTLLGLAVTIWLFYRYREGKLKHLWWLPIIYLIWANVHGGFTIGFLALGVIGLVELLKIWLFNGKILPLKYLAEPVMSWGQIRHCLIVVGLCLVATLLTPYGFGLYKDIYLTLSDKLVLASISEWQRVSFVHYNSFNYTAYIIIFFAAVAVAYRRFEPTRWVLTLVFLYLSFQHWRHMPFFMVMSIGIFAEMIDQHAGPWLDRLKTMPIVKVILIGVLVAVLNQRYYEVVTIGHDMDRNLVTMQFPLQAINWAKTHPEQIGTRMYNLYAWGGLLIWKFPEQKVYIDGRMPYWQTGASWPFYDHQLINRGGGDALATLDHYGIDWAIIPIKQPLDVTLMTNSQWRAVYNDNIAVIYTRRDVLERNGQ